MVAQTYEMCNHLFYFNYTVFFGCFNFYIYLCPAKLIVEMMIKSLFALTLSVLSMMSLSASAQENVVRTVADKGTSGKFFAKLCPTTDVAIDKTVADVFSVYTDGANARFAQGVFQGGNYVIKAGECVVIKTSVAKDVPYVSTTARRSSFTWNDLICPATDMSLEDFKTAYGVKDGKYIYMLTNLERNGGFGFTHFGGTTLKAGNFYLINTRAPGASARLNNVWMDAEGHEQDEATCIGTVEKSADDNEVYNLQGMKTTEPTTPGIYVSKGKKYILK